MHFWDTAVINVRILGPSHTVILPTFMILEMVTLVVEPTLALVTRGVGEEHALIMVLTQGLAVRG